MLDRKKRCVNKKWLKSQVRTELTIEVNNALKDGKLVHGTDLAKQVCWNPDASGGGWSPIHCALFN